MGYDPDLAPIFSDLRALVGEHVDPTELEARLRPLTRRLTTLEARAEKAEARLAVLEGGVVTPDPVSLTVTPAADLRDDAAIGTTVATYVTDGTVAVAGDDAALLAVEPGKIVTAASIMGLTELVFSLAATAPGRDPVVWDGSVPVEPAIVVTPGTGLANPSIGFGLGGIADWERDQPFMNVLKSGRQWTGHTGAGWGGVSDAAVAAVQDRDGWLTAMPAGAQRVEMLALWEQPREATALAGRYRLRFDGSGDVRLNGQRVTGNEGWIDYTPTGGGGITVGVYAVTAGNHPRNFSLVHERNVVAFDAGGIWAPQFLQVVRDIRVLRFMDMTRTNHSTQREWSNRPVPGDYTYERRGLPLELIADLANRVGSDPWYNIPHMATDEYVREAAKIFRADLDSRLRAHIEYSNESWNPAFGQTAWMDDRAEERWPGIDRTLGGRQWAAGRLVQIARIFAQVYGAAERRKRYAIICAVHPGNPWLARQMMTADRFREWDRTDGGDGSLPALHFDGYATTGYFALNVGGGAVADEIFGILQSQGEAAAIAKAIEYLDAGARRLPAQWAEHKAVADEFDLPLLVYEGGAHADPYGPLENDQRWIDLLNKVHDGSAMGTIYSRLLQAWKEIGGTVFCFFVLFSRPSKHGMFDHAEHWGQVTPRLAAIMGFNQDNPGWWETRAPGTFLGRA